MNFLQTTKASFRMGKQVASNVGRGCIPRNRYTSRAQVLAQQADFNGPAHSRAHAPESRTRFGLSRGPLIPNLYLPNQVSSIFRDVEHELNRLWGDETQAVARAPLGQVDIKELKDIYTFYVDTPGLTKEDISVRVTPDKLLIISGERTSGEARDQEAGYQRIERVHGKFSRTFQLPEKHIDVEGISAKVLNGVLTVVVPKKEPESEQAYQDVQIE